MTSYLTTVRLYFEPPKLVSLLICRHDSVTECQGNAESTLLLPWQQQVSTRKGICSVCSALWQCLMDKHENVADIQHSQLSPLLHPWTLGGTFIKIKKYFTVMHFCCGSILCSTGTRLPLSGPNMPFCASHFNLWGLGEDNSGRIILPPFFQLGGNLAF